MFIEDKKATKKKTPFQTCFTESLEKICMKPPGSNSAEYRH